MQDYWPEKFLNLLIILSFARPATKQICKVLMTMNQQGFHDKILSFHTPYFFTAFFLTIFDFSQCFTILISIQSMSPILYLLWLWPGQFYSGHSHSHNIQSGMHKSIFPHWKILQLSVVDGKEIWLKSVSQLNMYLDS